MIITEEYLISLIDKKIEGINSGRNDLFGDNIALIKELIKKIDDNASFKAVFIKELSDEIITDLLKDNEELKSNILYIKSLLFINENIKLSNKQKKYLDEFIDVLIEHINKYEYKIDVIAKRKKEDIKRLNKIKNKLIKGFALTKDDFDNIKLLEVTLIVLNNIFTFLNKYNVEVYNKNASNSSNAMDVVKPKLSLLEEILSIKINEDIVNEENADLSEKTVLIEQKKENEDEKTTELLEDIEIIDDSDKEIILSEEEQIDNDAIIQIEEISDDVLVNDESLEEEKEEKKENIDLFNAQSFEYEPKKKKKTVNNTSYVDNIVVLKEGLSELDFNYDKINSRNKNKLLKISNFDDFRLLLDLIKEKQAILNEDSLSIILSESNFKTVSSVNNLLKKYNAVSEEYLILLMNRVPYLFTNKGYANLLRVMDILKKYESIDREKIILFNPLLLALDSDKVKNIVNSVETLNVDINDILINKWLINVDEKKIKNNLETLILYKFDIKYIDKNTVGLLLNDNLPFILDQFIELNMVDYIYENPETSLRKVKTLIIKRLYYAFKNGLFVWKNNDKENIYDKYINYNYKVLSEEKIKQLIGKYPALEILEEGNRISLYTNNNLSNIKRSNELLFNRKVISRLKTYSVMSCLVENGVDAKEALLYAIRCNSYLEKFDIDEINSYIDNIWKGDN